MSEDTPYNPIGSRMRSARQALDLSQADLANMLGVSVPTISEWETGKKFPSTDRYDAIAKALNTRMSDLFPSGHSAKNQRISPDVGKNINNLLDILLRSHANITGTVIGNLQSADIVFDQLQKFIEKCGEEEVSAKDIMPFFSILREFNQSLHARVQKDGEEFIENLKLLLEKTNR